MTTTPPEAPPEPPPSQSGPRATREELKQLGRISRTTGPDRKVAGVAGGLARHLDVDPVILRVAFVVLVFFGGAGVIGYGLAWLLLPEDGNPRRPLGLDDRNRGIALVGVGVLAGLALLSDTFGNDFFPWPVAIVIGLVVFVVVGVLDRDHRVTPTAPPVPHTPDPVTGQLVPAAPGTYVTPPAYRPLPRNPRKRGPKLFFFTLALSVLGIATLGILDGADVLAVADPAYPAVVVGASGLMLLVGSRWGRAGGLIFVGLVAAAAMALASVASGVEGSDIERTPLRADQVDRTLQTDAGTISVDLRSVQDLAALDGRTISLEATFGEIQLVVPPGVSVVVDAHVRWGGDIELFGDSRGGFNVDDSARHDGGTGAPTITVDARLGAGSIEVRQEDPS